MFNSAVKKFANTLAVLILFFIQHIAYAVILIESKEEDGVMQKMYIDGMKIRIDTTSDPAYVIMDANQGTMFAVNQREKQLVDMGAMAKQSKSKQARKDKYDIQFKKKGRGPKIAGYKTNHYSLIVNGEICSEEYISDKVLKDLGIEQTLEKLANIFRDVTPDSLGTQNQSPCDGAESQVGELYLKIGFPMRSLNSDGSLQSEVTSINAKADAPSGGFEKPKGYKVVDMAKMMEGLSSMQSMTPDAMQNMDPEQMQQMMEQMGKQMQESMQKK